MKKMVGIFSKLGLLALFTVALACSNSNTASKNTEAKVVKEITEKTPNALQDVESFLSQNLPFYVATVEDGNARVRPFSFYMAYEGKLYFATSSEKGVYAQLTKNPNVEICSASANGEWIRIRGKAVVTQDLTIKEKAFEVAPYLKPLYQEPSNPHFIVYSIENGTASFNSSDGTAPRIVGF